LLAVVVWSRDVSSVHTVHAALLSLVLLTMGIIMPEICRELISKEINTRML